MSDRLKGCWVSFDRDIRTDDAESLLAAIRQLRGIAAVKEQVANSDDWMARTRVRSEIREAIVKLFEELG